MLWMSSRRQVGSNLYGQPQDQDARHGSRCCPEGDGTIASSDTQAVSPDAPSLMDDRGGTCQPSTCPATRALCYANGACDLVMPSVCASSHNGRLSGVPSPSRLAYPPRYRVAAATARATTAYVEEGAPLGTLIRLAQFASLSTSRGAAAAAGPFATRRDFPHGATPSGLCWADDKRRYE